MDVVAEQVDFGIYIPQISFGFEEMRARARLCEQLGVTSFWLYDHLYTPGLPAIRSPGGLDPRHRPADADRHAPRRPPRRQQQPPPPRPAGPDGDDVGCPVRAVGSNWASGSGSYEAEHREGGFAWGTLAERSARLAEGLEIVTRMFADERTTFEGVITRSTICRTCRGPVQTPRPPIHVGRHRRPLHPAAGRPATPTSGTSPPTGSGKAGRPIALDAALRAGGPRSRIRTPFPGGGAGARGRRPGRRRRGPGAGRAALSPARLGPARRRLYRHATGRSSTASGRSWTAGFTLFVFFPYDRGEEATFGCWRPR